MGEVAADAAAQVGDPPGGSLREPGGPVGGHQRSRGLFEAVGREVEPVGVRAELRPRPGSQPGLGQRGRDEGLVMAGRPGRGADGERVRGVVRRKRGEQAPPLGREQPAEDVDRAILAATRAQPPGGRAAGHPALCLGAAVPAAPGPTRPPSRRTCCLPRPVMGASAGIAASSGSVALAPGTVRPHVALAADAGSATAGQLRPEHDRPLVTTYVDPPPPAMPREQACTPGGGDQPAAVYRPGDSVV